MGELLKKLLWPFPWLVLDNKGSFGGFFDAVPEYLRVGNCFFLFPPFLLSFMYAVVAFKPDELDFSEHNYPEKGSLFHFLSILFTMNGLFVLYSILSKIGAGVMCSYTMVSWSILTFHTGSSALCSFFPELVESNAAFQMLATSSEFFRFPALVAATVTFTLWNFLLAPVIYYLVKTKSRRSGFLKFNLHWHMTEIHVLNYPIAVASTILSSSARAFTASDLWAALALAIGYAIFYVGVLDRLGVHLYVVFSPRSKVRRENLEFRDRRQLTVDWVCRSLLLLVLFSLGLQLPRVH